MSGKKKVLLLFLFFPFLPVLGQEMPLHPVSGKIFTPLVFNPAVAGSRDFISVDLLAALQKSQYTQLLSYNARLLKRPDKETRKSGTRQFSNIGIGGYLFNDLVGDYRNMGFSVAGAYHLPLSSKKLSFLSAAMALKGVSSRFPGDPDNNLAEINAIFPNLDAGLYYYNPFFYAGISATNILGDLKGSSFTGQDSLTVSRQYFLNTGFKVVLSRRLNIVIEPMIIAGSGDSLSKELTSIIHPGVKLYLGNFCTGSYINDLDKIPFFFLYKYPGFYIGTFFELPRKTPFYKKEITAEIVLGLNISKNNPAYNRKGQW